MTDLTVESTAREMLAALSSREISCAELMDLHLARIAERNPQLNAIVSLDEDRAREGARRGRPGPDDERGPCTGCRSRSRTPTRSRGGGRRTARRCYADHVPDRDELIVERIRRAGAVPIGKTNVPEFAAGTHTFNRVFGTTLNPVDPTPVARAGRAGERRARSRPGWCRSPRAPTWAARCATPRRSAASSVCARASAGSRSGRRTTSGRRTSVGGPMARNVGDLALLLSVIAGPDPRAPLALGDPARRSRRPSRARSLGLRVAVSTDLGGAVEVDAEVAAVVEAGAATMAAPARASRPRTPTSPAADETFRTLRAWHFQAGFGDARRHPEAFKPSLADNIRAGEGLTGADVARAYRAAHGAGRDDAAVLRGVRRAGAADAPGAAVPGRPGVPAAINGRPMATYLDWMRSAYFITVTGCPAVSVPAGPPGTDCRSASSSSPRTAPTAGCSRSRRPSRPSVAGLIIHREAVFLWTNGPCLWTTRRRLWRTRIP